MFWEELPKWMQLEPGFQDEGIPLTDQILERWKADVRNSRNYGYYSGWD